MIDFATYQFNNRQYDIALVNGDMYIDVDSPLRCATILNQGQNTIDLEPQIGYGIDDIEGTHLQNIDTVRMMEEFKKDNLELVNIEVDLNRKAIINIQANEL